MKKHCGRLGSKMVGKDKGWMVTPVADVAVPAPPSAIVIPPALAARKSIADVVAYLRIRPPGSQCGMTQGPKTNLHLHSEFMQRGIQVSYVGPYGNRIVTLVAINRSRTKSLKKYKASKRTKNQYLIGQIKKQGGIPANTPTYVQGNRTTLVRQLLKYVGTGNYCAKQALEDPRGPGWIVTVKVPIRP